VPHERKLIYFKTVSVSQRSAVLLRVWFGLYTIAIAVRLRCREKSKRSFWFSRQRLICSISLTLLSSFFFTHTHTHTYTHAHTHTQLAVKNIYLQSLSFILSPRMAAFRIESQHPTGNPVAVAVARTRAKETQRTIPQ
jgi:hypothetical protein